jgi:hypothetical protein
MTELIIEDRAYLSGLFDGEGSISVEREVRKDRGGQLRFRPVIAVSNTDRSVLDLFKSKVGHGWIYRVNRKGEEAEKWKPLYIWKAKGGSARFVVELILPYLQIKRPQADLILSGPANEQMWLECKTLNKRGRDLPGLEEEADEGSSG